MASQLNGRSYFPLTMYRSSSDISPWWESVLNNMQSLFPIADNNVSFPGSWAYADMLLPGYSNYLGTLPLVESRTQFGSWCILSSPLVLAINIIDDASLGPVLPFIGNPEAIAINQKYFGFSGNRFAATASSFSDGSMTLLFKPTSWDNTSVALMVVNIGDGGSTSGTIAFSDVPYFSVPAGRSVRVRDVWARADVGTFSTSYAFAPLAAHDTIFLTLSLA